MVGQSERSRLARAAIEVCPSGIAGNSDNPMLRELHVASDLAARQDAGRSGVKAVGTDGPGSAGREGQTSWDEIIKKWATVELVVHKGPREMKTSVATGPSEHPNWRRSGYDTVSTTGRSASGPPAAAGGSSAETAGTPLATRTALFHAPSPRHDAPSQARMIPIG